MLLFRHKVLIITGVLLCCLSFATSAGAQDTLFIHVRGVDTLFTELHRDASPVYLKNKPYRNPSVRTNLFYWGSGTPNLGFEVPVSGHLSAGANFGFKPWDRFFSNDPNLTAPRRWRNLVVSPEIRWYPDTVTNGLFVAADGLYTHYNTGNVRFPLGLYKNVRDEYVQGNLFGGGLAVGYTWWLTGNLRLEVEAGAAFGWFSHDTYYINDRCQNCIVDHEKGTAIVPKLGLNLAWTFGQPKREQIEEVIVHPVDTIKPIFLQPYLPLVDEWKGVAGQLEKNHPVLRPSSEYKPYSPDMILRKMDDPLYVHFVLDKIVIEPDYRNNRSVLDQIIDITSQIVADTTSTVSCIQIIGLASIEGNARHNQQLSDGRAKALQKYITDRVAVSPDVFESVSGGEAWTEFRDQVGDLILAGGGEGLTVAQLQRVLDIIDTEADIAKRERRIRSLEGGSVYEKLRGPLLADQRNSGYIRIYYDYVPDNNARQINAAIAALRDGRADEALRLLEPVKDDPRAANTLGIALWETGRQEEAVAVLRASAASGDAAAARNLEEMERVIEHNSHVGDIIYEIK